MEFRSNKAIYLQIVEMLMDEILAGTLAEGERMPSVREYAGRVEVNVNTVVRSFDWLAQREVIFQQRGLGYFVSEGAAARILAVRREDFFENELPRMFETMQKLGVSIDDVKERYADATAE